MYKKIVTAFLALMLLFTTAGIGFASNNGENAIDQDVIFINGEPEFVNSSSDIGILNVTGCDYTLSGYQYHSTSSFSGSVTKVLGSTASIIVTTSFPWLKPVTKIGVQVANTFNMVYGSNVYITQSYYRMFAQTGKSPLPVAAERTVTRYYSDSSRTKLTDTKVHYNYSKWYCK